MKKPREQVAVVAHSGKTFGGGLGALRKALARAGHHQPLWYEVSRSRKAPRAARRAVKHGAKLVFVWGGDGMVQQCVDALAGSGVRMAILPAGTANLVAASLGIPRDVAAAVQIGLHGAHRALDAGVINGERFAAMAGTGFDAIMMRNVNARAKKTIGRLAYFRSSVQALRKKSVRMTIRVDGAKWFSGKASCLLLGNIGTITGGLPVFPQASSSDGLLEIGVVTADTAVQWARVLSRVATGHPERSPLVRTTRGKKVVVKLRRKAPYELDGGARPPTRRLKARVEAGAITVCVPSKRASQRQTLAAGARRDGETGRARAGMKPRNGHTNGGAGQGRDHDIGREVMSRGDALHGDAAAHHAGDDPRPDTRAVAPLHGE
jgi:diacylglycerol kinase (ATP)